MANYQALELIGITFLPPRMVMMIRNNIWISFIPELDTYKGTKVHAQKRF